MPFVPPNYNILCNIYTYEGATTTWPAIPMNPPRLSNVPCALVYGRRANVASTGGTGAEGVLLIAMNLLLSKGTDLRGLQDTVGQDVVECPAGSGRWYAVNSVDDISKGYATEHRTGTLQSIQGTWTAPYA